jgi:hypothetical protein
MIKNESIEQVKNEIHKLTWIQTDLNEALGAMERLTVNATLRSLSPTAPLRCVNTATMIGDLLRTVRDRLQELEGQRLALRAQENKAKFELA